MFENSESLYKRATNVAPSGVHSPVRAFKAVGGNPLFFESAHDQKITDVDNNTYTDYCMSWGALALGHANPHVTEAIQQQAAKGTHYGTPTRHDVELAELVLDKIAPFDHIRFVNSGTEAVMTAIRLARGITQKKKVVKINGSYHGHFDPLLVAAGSGLVTQGQSASAGITPGAVEDTLVIPFDDIEALEKVFTQYSEDIAVVCVEPVMANNGLFEFSPDYFSKLRQLCDKYNSLMLFDEVITGFRVHEGGAKAYYNASPDLACYGKVIGGGMPIGAVASKKEIMNHLAPNGNVYQAGTLSGNPLAMVAGVASLKQLFNCGFYEKMHELGQYLDTKLTQAMKQSTLDFSYKRVQGIFWLYPGFTELPKSPAAINSKAANIYKEIYHKFLSAGIYLSPSAYEVAFLSYQHTFADIDHLAQTLIDL